MSRINKKKPLGLFRPTPGEGRSEFAQRVVRRLQHAHRTGRPDVIDTQGPVHYQPELLTKEEVHRFGINIVTTWMIEQGYRIDALEYDAAWDPQIVAHREGERFHVVVRTACYPEKGELEDSWVYRIAACTLTHPDAKCFFASVGLCNASGTTQEAMSRPVRTAPFHVWFGGLEPLPAPLQGVIVLGREPTELLDS